MADLAVVGPDPAFGGGSAAQADAFLRAARELGRAPEYHFDPHPALHGRRFTLDRLEAVRQLRAARRLAPALAGAESVWAMGPLATHGLAATRSGRPYRCWLGTSLAEEWRGRARGLDPLRRAAQAANAPALRRIERTVVRGAERVYAISSYAGASLATACGLAPDAVEVLPLPVDVDVLTPEPEEEWLSRLESPTLAFVGRADDPRKNVGLLLDALPSIPRARVRLIGRPPGEVPPQVDVLGQVASISGPLRSSTLLILPSWQEGFGIVAAEALAAGVPFVTTPCGGPEVLARASGGGIVLSSFEAAELAETVTGLLGDAATLARMRRSGREYVVREHSPERFRSLLAAAL
jgi:glycosyltransferase involved in cell wall biosynthesis